MSGKLAVIGLAGLFPVRMSIRADNEPALSYLCSHSDVDFGLTTILAWAWATCLLLCDASHKLTLG